MNDRDSSGLVLAFLLGLLFLLLLLFLGGRRDGLWIEVHRHPVVDPRPWWHPYNPW